MQGRPDAARAMYHATKDTVRARRSLEKALSLQLRPELAADAGKVLQALGS